MTPSPSSSAAISSARRGSTRRSPARASSRPMPASAMPRARACAGTVGRRFRFRAGRACRDASPRVPRRNFRPDKDKTDGELAVAGGAGARRDVAWCWPARSAASAPTTPSCIWRWRCGWPRPGMRPADQRRAGRRPAAAGRDAIRLCATARCFRARLLRSVRPERCRRQMAARPRHVALRLVADHLQRGQRPPRARARPAAARCCSRTLSRPKADHGAAASQSRRDRPDLRRHAAARRRRAVGVGRRPDRAGRPQRLRQVDAAEDRRRPDRAAGRRGLPPAFGDRALSAARCRIMEGFATVARLCRGRARPGRRSLPRHLSDGASRPDRRGTAGRALRRRGAPRRACPRHGAGARHPAARRADQPSRPRRPSNGWKTSCSTLASALVVISHDRRFLERVSRATVWLDRGQTRRLDKGFAPFRGMARHRCSRRKSASSTSSAARSCARSTGCATA